MGKEMEHQSIKNIEKVCSHPCMMDDINLDKNVRLEDVLDIKIFQSLLEGFYKLTGIGVAILNIEGKVLVSIGWQEICTNFHRVNPLTAKHCIESDTVLSSGVKLGDFKLYKCKNNMWDIVSPIVIDDKHLGNLFLGQFFFDDEEVDKEFFRQQAQECGFNEEEYLEALSSVPRWSRDTVYTTMRFYSTLAMMASQIGYSNITLAGLLEEREKYISELKQTEEALWHEKNEKDAILANLAEQVTFLDLDMKIIWANSKVIDRHDLSSKEYIGEKCYRAFHQLDKPCPDCAITEVFSTGIAKSGIHRSPDGLYWKMSGIPVLDSNGEMIGVLDTALDVTDLVLAEQALQESENRLNRMLNVFPDMVSVHDPDMNIVYSNWNGFAAVPPEKQILNTKCYKTYRDYDQICPDCRAVSVLKNKLAFQAEVELTKDYWIDLRVIPLLDSDGEIEYFIEWVRDISKMKEIENQLRIFNQELDKKVQERTAQLEAANRELDAFAYSASHDLRGPLNRIIGFSNALLEDQGDHLDQQGQDFLRRINNSGQNMSELIDDLLQLSKVSRMEINSEPVELSVIVNVCLKELQAKESQRELEAVIAPGLVVDGDTALLRIALENLVNNAWKFTGKEEKARIEFGATEKDGQSVYYIRDNGDGFDNKHANRLFTPFQRLHSEKEFSGTGIGLSIVSRIIQRHGGEVWAKGEKGKGACFYFTLPNR